VFATDPSPGAQHSSAGVITAQICSITSAGFSFSMKWPLFVSVTWVAPSDVARSPAAQFAASDPVPPESKDIHEPADGGSTAATGVCERVELETLG